MTRARQQFDQLLQLCLHLGASDLHLSAGVAPHLRIHGRLQAQGDALSAEALQAMARDCLTPALQEQLQRELNADLGYSLPGGERFRINVYVENGQLAFAIRRLNDKIRSLHELYLPERLSALTAFKDGLVLVTGATGSGKSTTLAMLIEQINREHAYHILTIEDPVEYRFQPRRSLIHQRELHRDVPSFASAVRAALREDPDVILVGEMRDLETMRAAVTAAETGHLVFSTLHTGDAVGAIDRIVGGFPAQEQEHIRLQLSLVLRAVVTQHLLPGRNGQGRVPALEMLMITPAVASLIRQNKPRQILSLMETGASLGMQTLEQSLARLVTDALIEPEVAQLVARDGSQLERLLASRKNAEGAQRSWR